MPKSYHLSIPDDEVETVEKYIRDQDNSVFQLERFISVDDDMVEVSWQNSWVNSEQRRKLKGSICAVIDIRSLGKKTVYSVSWKNTKEPKAALMENPMMKKDFRRWYDNHSKKKRRHRSPLIEEVDQNPTPKKIRLDLRTQNKTKEQAASMLGGQKATTSGGPTTTTSGGPTTTTSGGRTTTPSGGRTTTPSIDWTLTPLSDG